MQDFFHDCYLALMDNDINNKCQRIKQIQENWHNHCYDMVSRTPVEKIINPGRPAEPELVDPRFVGKRRLGTPSGHISLIHALTHIEFNAINLALDACYRFQDMPHAYFTNWLEVAADEARHFGLLRDHLVSLGSYYGALSAHNGLWDMALRTDNDVMLRMALVPRVLEARGLDAIPDMQEKIARLGDSAGAKILDIIYHDEIKHVRYGDDWFKFECQKRGLNAEMTYFTLLSDFNAPKIRGSYNREGRQLAGFSIAELDQLTLIKDN